MMKVRSAFQKAVLGGGAVGMLGFHLIIRVGGITGVVVLLEGAGTSIDVGVHTKVERLVYSDILE